MSSNSPYEHSPGGMGQGRRLPGMAAPQQQSQSQQQQQQQQQLAQSQRETSAGPSSAGGDTDRSSSFSKSFGFLKLGSDRKTKDGQPQKRRGPKPDSKPALTRRQELNRQAPRTHRERKEFYIKSLENEVMHLKEVYTGTVQEKDAVEQENQRLKELLRLHGISFDGGSTSQAGDPMGNFAPASASATSQVGGGNAGHFQASNYGSPPQFLSGSTTTEMFGGSDFNDPSGFHAPQHQGSAPQQGPPQHQAHPSMHGDLDYEQLGVEFVLASVSPDHGGGSGGGGPAFSGYNLRGGSSRRLEAACSDHLQYMCVRATSDAEQPPNGHALMMSCPPPSHIAQNPDEPYPHQAPALPASNLNRLLEAAQGLTFEHGEITPVIALHLMRTHPRFHELSAADLERVKNELRGKTRCYGFGAVLEEFELRDALQSVFATKLESYTMYS